LGLKKAFYRIKALKDSEFLQVNHELHKISKAIVEEAERTNAVIVIGKLKGIRNRIKERSQVPSPSLHPMTVVISHVLNCL
jgi:rRNA-processing protein FCF1